MRAERCPVGSRLVATFTLDGLEVTQETLLWDGAGRVEFRTHVDGYTGQDRLLRVRFPADVPGGLPVYQTATAVIGRSFGAVDVDSADHWYTLDNPAHQWFGTGSVARVRDRSGLSQAIGVAEVVGPLLPNGAGGLLRDLLVALAAAGVTATCSQADGTRYGAVDVDSNLPDVRIAVGGPEVNPFTAEVLSAAGPEYAKALAARLAEEPGTARLWVPAARDRADAFGPDADVRGASDLPVLIVAGDLAAAVTDLVGDLADAVVDTGDAVADAVAARGAAGGPVGRAAEPRHARRRGHAGRDAAHVADAVVQRVAVGDLDRRGAPHRAGRQQLRLAALEPHVRVRAGLRVRGLARGRLQPAGRGLHHDLLAVAGAGPVSSRRGAAAACRWSRARSRSAR